MNSESMVFETLYCTAHLIDFDPSWANDTGYFDHVVKSGITKRSRFIDDHNRRVLVIPTEDEFVVINERYKHGKNGTIVTMVYRK